MSMSSGSQQHDVQLEKAYPSGAEEWYCPTCGRRLLMQWSPDYRKIILEPSDEYAMHSGGNGGLRLEPPQISEAEDEPVLSDELRAALEEALDDINFDDWLSAAGGLTCKTLPSKRALRAGTMADSSDGSATVTTSSRR